MRAVFSWLKDFVEISETPEELSRVLTRTGSKAETLIREAGEIKKVVVGRICDINRHPNADSLVICDVDINAEDGKKLRIVTGAKNIKKGDKVPLALEGACLASGIKIKKTVLRGEKSDGMLCSIAELGFNRDDYPEAPENGIFILNPNTPLGVTIQEAMGWKDTAIDFEITSNRPDCFSEEGLGREAALSLGRHFKRLDPVVIEKGEKASADYVSVQNLAETDCPVYRARVITDVKTAPSPEWMRKRLRLSGIRPINNIVDITNYVMLELGHPMHAFDYREIKKGEIIVRRAYEGEKLVTLDKVERELDENCLVIANPEHSMALAGVMGGEESGIHKDTETVVFEAALFLPLRVRYASAKLKLRSESSSRFERGLDFNNTQRALDRACQLVEQLGCGKVCRGTVSAEGKIPSVRRIEWTASGINKFLGTEISADYMQDLFVKLECRPVKEKRGERGDLEGGTVEIPGFRPDLQCLADLSEEVARFFGYNNIKATLLSGKSFTRGGYSAEQLMVQKLIDTAVYRSYYQTESYSYESTRLDDMLLMPENSFLRKHVQIANSTEESKNLRTSMLVSMLNTVSINYSRGAAKGKFFEIGTVYIPRDEKAFELLPDEPQKALPDERKIFSAISFNNDEKKSGGRGFFELKSLAEDIFEVFGIKGVEMRKATPLPAFNPYRSSEIAINGDIVGFSGYFMPEICKNFSVPESTVYLELDIRKIFEKASLKRSQKPISRFPQVSRDLAFVLEKSVDASSVESVIAESGKPLLSEYSLFDLYEGPQAGPGKKSMAYTLIFRSLEKTLTDQEINEQINKIVEELKKKYSCEIRGI